jgi:hypothetical protein
MGRLSRRACAPGGAVVAGREIGLMGRAGASTAVRAGRLVSGAYGAESKGLRAAKGVGTDRWGPSGRGRWRAGAAGSSTDIVGPPGIEGRERARERGRWDGWAERLVEGGPGLLSPFLLF